MSETINRNIVSGTKWSALTEISAKISSALVSMILARLLVPEAFGVVASVMMVISFAQLFADAGFQKYVVQHELLPDEKLSEISNVAFWCNFVVSVVATMMIILFREPLSSLVGCPGLGKVLAVASLSIPLVSFSSVQMSLYRRSFDFKTLFGVRLVAIVIPIVVTVPLAFLWRSYWALVLGTLLQHTVNAILLLVLSKWKPSFGFSFPLLERMIAFSVWSLIESVSVWLTHTVDMFIVGTTLSQYYLGLYKTSYVLITQFFCVVTSITNPVLFSSLSRLQHDREAFLGLFSKFQETVAFFVFPIGVFIFCYHDWVTKFFLGYQWMEAAKYIGLLGLIFPFVTVISRFCSELYRSLGRPKLSVLAQWLYILVLWPFVLWTVNFDFMVLCEAKVCAMLVFVFIHLIIMWTLLHVSPWQMIKPIFPIAAVSFVVILLSHILALVSDSVLWRISTAVITLGTYFIVVLMIPRKWTMVMNIRHLLMRKTQ